MVPPVSVTESGSASLRTRRVGPGSAGEAGEEARCADVLVRRIGTDSELSVGRRAGVGRRLRLVVGVGCAWRQGGWGGGGGGGGGLVPVGDGVVWVGVEEVVAGEVGKTALVDGRAVEHGGEEGPGEGVGGDDVEAPCPAACGASSSLCPDEYAPAAASHGHHRRDLTFISCRVPPLRDAPHHTPNP